MKNGKDHTRVDGQTVTPPERATASSNGAQPTGLALLRVPFPPHQISKLPKPFKKDSQKGNCKECGGYHGLPALHLDYVGHAALTDRLLDADPMWTWEPVADPKSLGLPVAEGMWIRLTVCGVTRFGFGSADGKHGGDAVKEMIGDALRNAAMRFGAALDLWHKGQLHEDEEADPEPPATDGFDDWLVDMEAVAETEGYQALVKAIGSSNEAYRTRLKSTGGKQWAAMKEKAEKYDAKALVTT
jgi:hypothetical protein